MASKSKKNRRYIQPAKKANSSPVTQQMSETPVAADNANKATAPARSVLSAKTATMTADYSLSFFRDLKWIALVTGIVVVLLIVAYYLFR